MAAIPCPPAVIAAPQMSSADWLHFLATHPGWRKPIRAVAVGALSAGLATDCTPPPSPLPHGPYWAGEVQDTGGPSTSYGTFGPGAFDFRTVGGGVGAYAPGGFGYGFGGLSDIPIRRGGTTPPVEALPPPLGSAPNGGEARGNGPQTGDRANGPLTVGESPTPQDVAEPAALALVVAGLLVVAVWRVRA